MDKLHNFERKGRNKMTKELIKLIGKWVEEKLLESEILYKYGEREKARIIKQLLDELINL